MKKLILFTLILLSNLSHSQWMTNFDEAKKLALATDKFMIVDFWATWCGPCKKMDFTSWNDKDVVATLDNYIQVKIDIDEYKDIAGQYGINSIPNMFILDGNGKVVHSFVGYQTPLELLKELTKFALNAEYLSPDLINQYKYPSTNSSLRAAQRYLDYSLYVDKDIKSNFLKTSDEYLDLAKSYQNKKDENYQSVKQKIQLLEMYRLAYQFNFEKLKKKTSELKESAILDDNKDKFYFLQYIASKALKSDDFASIEEKVKALEGGTDFITKADLIISKKI